MSSYFGCKLCLAAVLLIAFLLIGLLIQAIASSAAVASLTAFIITHFGLAVEAADGLIHKLLYVAAAILGSGAAFLADWLCKELGACP